MYIELHTSSAFSFLDGASLPAALIERAAELGYPALALLDRDGVYGAPQFYRAANAAGIKAIVGAELTMGQAAPSGRGAAASRSRSRRPMPSTPAVAVAWTLPVLVTSAEGYRNLCRVLTRAKLRSPKGEMRLTLSDLTGATSGLVALIGREALRAERYGVGGLIDQLVGTFGRGQVWIELQRHHQRDEQADLQSLLDLSAAFRVPVMASNGVRFATPASRPLYDVFTSLRHKTTLARAGRLLTANAERYLKSPEMMTRLFADLPQALAGTEALAERIEFTLGNLGYRFPTYPVPAGESEASFLRRITQVGVRDRYRPPSDRVKAQIARELDLIERLQLSGYFLIVWDIVNFCRQQRILVQGRGSAANSAVCYALGITAVDPVGMDLLFERFLSEERGEWPDIDLDLPSGDRRERVIQYVYERYGTLGAAMTANVITYRGRSATREIGKVLELDAGAVDHLARLMSQFEYVDPDETIARHLRESGLNPEDERHRQFAKLWMEMQDLPRHLGQHSGGMVLCQGRLDEIVPLENASMPGRVVVQWDKDDCADLGLIKVDLLGLGMMAVLEDAIAIINGEREGAGVPAQAGESRADAADPDRPKVDLAHLPPDDPAVYAMLRQADTIGVFQVESRAQMATLPRMAPEHFYDLVVEVAIIRPGPIVGKMVHPYLARRRGDQPVTYAHPLLEPVLKRTLGVPLFQEQLLRMSMVVAGFSGGEAEELRRAMGFKRSVKRMQQIEERLRDGMTVRGIVGHVADEIVLSITSFALYGFPESHAASFALLVYASAYLKVHYPAAFYVALLNNQPMGFYHPATLVKDAQRRGVRFRPIDIQRSGWECAVDESGAVRLGLRHVKGLRAEVGQAIGTTPARAGGVRFASLDDLVRKTGVRQDEMRALAEIGAFAPFGGDRRTALWQAERAARQTGELLVDPDDDPVASVGPIAPVAPVGPVAPVAPQEEMTSERTFQSPVVPVEPEIPVAPVGPVAPVAPVAPQEEMTSERTFQSPVVPVEPEIPVVPVAPVAPVVPGGPLRSMTLSERVQADYDRTGLTIGPHPMALVRPSLAPRGIARASDLARTRPGRRVRVAGAVITRQRPGTAKGFVFLSLEDETGIANIIVTPDIFAAYKRVIVDEPYLIVEGPLQNQDGAVSVKAERVDALAVKAPVVEAHNFH